MWLDEGRIPVCEENAFQVLKQNGPTPVIARGWADFASSVICQKEPSLLTS